MKILPFENFKHFNIGVFPGAGQFDKVAVFKYRSAGFRVRACVTARYDVCRDDGLNIRSFRRGGLW